MSISLRSVCPYKLQILADFIPNNVFSFIWTPCERNRHTCGQFKTFKFDYLELGRPNKKITNIIDDQVPKTYLTPTWFYWYNHFKANILYSYTTTYFFVIHHRHFGGKVTDSAKDLKRLYLNLVTDTMPFTFVYRTADTCICCIYASTERSCSVHKFGGSITRGPIAKYFFGCWEKWHQLCMKTIKISSFGF